MLSSPRSIIQNKYLLIFFVRFKIVAADYNVDLKISKIVANIQNTRIIFLQSFKNK